MPTFPRLAAALAVAALPAAVPAVASAAPKIKLSTSEIVTNAPINTAGPTKTVTITNKGTTALTLPAGAFSLGGGSGSPFEIVDAPSLPATVAPGAHVDLGLALDTPTLGPQGDTLSIQSNDRLHPVVSVKLRGLGTKGLFGNKEPSLQWILDTYQVGNVQVGDDNPANAALDYVAPPGVEDDQLPIQSFVVASPGKVTMQALAAFSLTSSKGYVYGFGWYPTGTTAKTKVFTVPNAGDQLVDPPVSGPLKFNPGTQAFGFWATFPAFKDGGKARQIWSEDALNTWDAAHDHKIRVYPYENPDGSAVANAYVIAVEEYTGPYDYQDAVVLVRNVKPAP